MIYKSVYKGSQVDNILSQVASKQDKLSAGSGIFISSDNVISSTQKAFSLVNDLPKVPNVNLIYILQSDNTYTEYIYNGKWIPVSQPITGEFASLESVNNLTTLINSINDNYTKLSDTLKSIDAKYKHTLSKFTSGTYTKVTTDTYGRVISGSQLTVSDLPSIPYSKVINTPTTLSGYGINDVHISNGTITIGDNSITPITKHQDISNKADKASTLAGYGIVDAYISDYKITLGSNSITPLTKHQDISGKANKATTLSGYNIKDAYINGNTIFLGDKSITPITTHQSLDSKADKATTLEGYGITDGFNTVNYLGKGPLISTIEKDPKDSHSLNIKRISLKDLLAESSSTTADEWFELVNVGTSYKPVWAIHVKHGYGFYSDSFISALGANSDGIGTGSSGSGGSSYELIDTISQLNALTDSEQYAASGALIKEILGQLSNYVTASTLNNYITKSHLDAALRGYATRDWVTENFVDFTSDQTITGIKTFTNGIKIGNAYLHWDDTYKAVAIDSPLYSESWIAALGANDSISGGSGSGSIGELMNQWGDYNTFEDPTHVATGANLTYELYNRLNNLTDNVPAAYNTLLKISQAIENNKSSVNNVLSSIGNKADKSIRINAGNGLSGGGDLSSNITLKVINANDSILVTKDGISVNVVNNLTSDSTTKPLSAYQGKVLNTRITELEEKLDDMFTKVNIGTAENPEWVIRANYSLYSVGWISALGANASTGGGSGSVKLMTESWTANVPSNPSSVALGADLGIDLNTRLSNVESGSATTWNTSGSGNGVSNITKSGNIVTVTKANFATSSTISTQITNNNKNYYTKIEVDNKINALIDDEGATAALDTIKELADFLTDDTVTGGLVKQLDSIRDNAISSLSDYIPAKGDRPTSIKATYVDGDTKVDLITYETIAQTEVNALFT